MRGKFLITVDDLARMIRNTGMVSDIQVMERFGVGPSSIREIKKILLVRYPGIEWKNDTFTLKEKKEEGPRYSGES